MSMDDNVISIVQSNFNLDHDINDLEKWILETSPFSADKLQVQHLLALICENEDAELPHRMRAAEILIRTSDLKDAITKVPGVLEQFVQAFSRDSLRH